MTQMGGVQEENHLVALFPPGGLHEHCPGELTPLITTISIGIKLPQKCSAKQTYNLVIKFVGDVRTRQRSLGLKDLIVGWTVLLSSELLRGTGWEGAGKGGYVGEQGCLRRKDGSATLYFGQLHLCETNERTTNENRRPRRNPCRNRSSETKTLNRNDSLNFSQDYLNNHDCIVTILSGERDVSENAPQKAV